MESFSFILPAISILAILTLVSPRPSLSATMLFLESILVSLAITNNQDMNIAGTSILLSFFTMITIGANYYLELPEHSHKIKPSKLSLTIGLFSLFAFWQTAKFFPPIPQGENHLQASLQPSFIEITVLGFTFFSILVAAISILDLKNPKRGRKT